MPAVTIYHNPRCSKSRQTLALLKEKDFQPQVIEYLDSPPDADTLRLLVKQLGCDPEDLVRPKEFQELGVPKPADESGWIELMIKHPRIMQRPIVVSGAKAALGRPPENVLAILD